MSRQTDALCPFCGSDKMVMKKKNDDSGDYNYTYWKVKCDYCGASGPWEDSPDKALTKWNTRKGKE